MDKATWWNQNGSSSDDIITASSEESGSGSNGGDDVGMAGPSSGFINFFDKSTSDDDIKRTIKTAKDKRFTELDKSVKKIKNSMKINDWSAVFEEWAALQKLVEKAKPVLTTSGLPAFYVLMIVSLEDLITKAYANKEMKKNMKPKNAKALNAMKQHFNKYIEKNEYSIKEKMEAAKKSQAGKTPKAGGSSSGSGGSSGSGADPGWDIDLTPNEPGLGPVDDETKLQWTQERIDRKVKEMLSKRGTKHYDKKEHLLVFRFLRSKCDGLSNKLTLDFHVINALFDMANPAHPMSGLIWKKVYNCLVSIVDTLVENKLLVLYEAKEDLVAAIGDDSTEKLSEAKRASVVVGHLMFSLERLGDEYYHSLQNIEAPSEQYLIRLSYENPMLRLLQYAHNYYSSKNDVKRATIIAQRMLSILYYRKEVATKDKEAFQAKGTEQAASLPVRVVNTDLPDPTLTKQAFKPVIKKKSAAAGEDDSESEEESNEEEAILEPGEVEEDIYAPPSVPDKWDLLTLVPALVSQVCKHSPEERSKRKAILQLVYHLALHGKFYEARDCLLMTHLQEKINKASFALQVLFNRAMVQLGFAAFRIGRIKDAHNCLSEIASGGKSKELLAQGVNPRYQSEKSKEQEKQEYRRQIPYHMHINLELLECIHLVCAMLLEVPNMAQCRNRDNKRKVISKFFQKVINYYDRQLFTGPPENTRESIIIAAKALEQGDWKKCRDDILALPIWQLLPENEGIKVLVAREIQEQAIRTYLFSYGRYYDSLSLAELCAMFELEKNEVHSLVSKMIINEDLHASWDQPTGALIIHGQDPTALQSLALSYAEKISVLSETSETIEQRNFVDRRGPAGKGPGGKDETFVKYGTSYVNYSSSFTPNFNYSRGAVGVTPNQARQIPRVNPAPTTRSPVVSLQASGGFVQQQKKGKARPVGRK